MRVSALSPLFVHETPEEPEADAKRIVADSGARDRGVRETTPDEASSDVLDDRTREGLRRLSRLLIEKVKPEDDKGKERKSSRSKLSPQPLTLAVAEPDESSSDEAEDATASVSLTGTLEAMSPLHTEVVYLNDRRKALKTYRDTLDAGIADYAIGQFVRIAA